MNKIKKGNGIFIGIATFTLVFWWLFSLGVIPSLLQASHSLLINWQPQFLGTLFSFGVFFYP
ncbi:MAG: hypothetical protein M1421_06510 [Candidatus Eremiobacteraeota bacterium]|nr:hypothetical protein [Candidatus Eremiobacteraeota bacterium]MCL5055976.1 hypothetical protein [Bacillota bacterium]